MPLDMNKTNTAHKLIVGLFLAAFCLPVAVFSAEAEGYENEENRMEDHFSIDYKEVDRVEVLTTFLERYNSPLIDEVEAFIRVADENDLDYRLLPAISCIESTCGRFLIPGTYNAWGWGIYGNNVIGFSSWEEGIETVGEGIAENYVKRGLDTPEKMAPVYTPPNSAHWRNSVRHFMRQMDEIALSI